MKRTTVATKTEASDRPVVRSASSEESELVQRIAATPAFSRAPLLTRFLLYVCECKADGRDEEITEHQIGVHALGRPEFYSPARTTLSGTMPESCVSDWKNTLPVMGAMSLCGS